LFIFSSKNDSVSDNLKAEENLYLIVEKRDLQPITNVAMFLSR